LAVAGLAKDLSGEMGCLVTELLKLNSLSRRFGGLQALENVSLSIGAGEVVGLIGPNGAGKTTLVNVITGVHTATGGHVIYRGKDITRYKPYEAARIGLARTFQIVQPFPDLTVLDNVTAAALFSSSGSSIHQAQEFAREQLEFVGLSAQVNSPAASLTLAMRKRLELAKTLAMRPKLLFLDEVNAGLNSAEVEQAMSLIKKIAATGTTIVLIEHLIKVVVTVCSRIVVLHNGQLISQGDPRHVVNDPKVIEAYLGKRYSQAAKDHIKNAEVSLD
jgi:branched-chain amino acid transport system ATP-binding protein